MRAVEDVEARFMRFVLIDPTTGCWLWQGARVGDGYGRFSVRCRDIRAHKWAYEHWVGPVPEGLQLDHFKCDTPSCANPFHVRPTTPRENVLRSNSPTAWHAAKTHCPQGHPYAGDNLYETPRRRRCRECLRVQNQEPERLARRARQRRLNRQAKRAAGAAA